MPNIFKIIEKVTSRIEPFHSEFLADALRKNSSLLVGLLHLIQNQTRINLSDLINANQFEVISEDSFDDNKRIDIVILSPASKDIVGIEVKTTDSSVRDNQLNEYYAKLTNKYPGKRIIFVFLTPYNIDNLPEEINPSNIKAIKEFSYYASNHTNSVHLNWDQVISLYQDLDNYAGSIFESHHDFIQKRVTNTAKLISRLSNLERNRGLADFFGEECVETFLEKIMDSNITYQENESNITFPIPNNTTAIGNLLSLFSILIESDNLKKTVKRQDRVEKALILSYENSSHGDFFISFFDLIHSYKYLWIEGKGNLGIRAAHESHPSSGVSLFTIDRNSIAIRKTR
ncbi:PD-(D/E)XK nuclease family protein [uncultured Draconibacterium sp.]|uniref:PD-(D/E)XK nuclease family protein n=1 Tax=uncultured Draconibacterium sp. TaxID=1573823 RepID=UPI0025D9D853|nr:PD-(D/E)XK nuclease family protein [uncultured Draconibacterium sp.]